MRLLLTAACAIIAGCTTLDEKIAMAPRASSYSLCEAMVTATFADRQLREAWAQELARRGENCSQYTGMISAKIQADAQFQQSASQLRQQILQPGGLVAPRPIVVESAAPTPRPVKGILKGNFMNGATKVCIYDRLGTEYYVTIPPQNFCPSVAD